MVYEQIGRAHRDCGALAEETDYERQTDGSRGIGRGVCCGDGGGGGGGGGGGFGGGEDPGAASYRGEGLQSHGGGRGHCFAPPRYTRDEDASDRPEYVALGS